LRKSHAGGTERALGAITSGLEECGEAEPGSRYSLWGVVESASCSSTGFNYHPGACSFP
jgi:hypothetical protein